MKESKLFQSDGSTRYGIFANPPDSTTCVILCHGFKSDLNSDTNKIMEEKLNKANIATFRFDFFGHGRSDGAFEEITPFKAVDDAHAAVELMLQKGFTKIGIVGASFGGLVAMLTSSAMKEIAFTALKCPAIDLAEGIMEQDEKEKKGQLRRWKRDGYTMYLDQFRLNYDFYEVAESIHGYSEAEQVTVPTIIVHGDDDQIVPIKQAIEASKRIKNCKLEIIKGADHRFSKNEDFDRMIELLCRFIIKNS